MGLDQGGRDRPTAAPGMCPHRLRADVRPGRPVAEALGIHPDVRPAAADLVDSVVLVAAATAMAVVLAGEAPAEATAVAVLAAAVTAAAIINACF